VPTTFISYRRDDAEPFARRIYYRLLRLRGAGSVFIDFDSCAFRQPNSEALPTCRVLLAVLGFDWAGKSKNGQCRIDDPADYVRKEVEAALRNDFHLVPITVWGTAFPTTSDLPVSLWQLAFAKGFPIDSGGRFESDVKSLSAHLDQLELMPRKHPIFPCVFGSSLTIEHGPQRGREFVLENERVVIGRHPECDIRDIHLDSGTLSLYHAQLVQTVDGHIIEDLESRSGTYVNERIVHRQDLEHRDRIRIGKCRLIYRRGFAEYEGES
jgi:hypothetical protein